MARSKSPAGNKQPKDPIGNSASAMSAAAALAENSPRETSMKMGAARSDARPNLFPINLEDEIRRRAYELSERRGFEAGHETDDWLSAEREVLERYHQQSA